MSDKKDIINNNDILNEKELEDVAGGMQMGYATVRDYPGALAAYAGDPVYGKPGEPQINNVTTKKSN